VEENVKGKKCLWEEEEEINGLGLIFKASFVAYSI
jgi:hypothetical protein